MDTRDTTCQKCDQSATVTVTLDFKPGGTQVFRLCDDHAGYLYLSVVHWYSGQDGPEKGAELLPGYRKAAGESGPVTDTSPRPQPAPQ